MSNCSCVFVDSFDYPEFHRAKIQKARKYHTCCECGRLIEPFEEYEYACGMWENCFNVFKTCSDCLSIRKEFFCGGFEYEGMKMLLWEHLQEMDGDVSEDCLNIFSALTPRAKSMVCEMIEQIWDDE